MKKYSVMIKVVKQLIPATSWRKGVPLSELTKKIYGEDTAKNRDNLRAVIARLVSRGFDIYSVKKISSGEVRFVHVSRKKKFKEKIELVFNVKLSD